MSLDVSKHGIDVGPATDERLSRWNETLERAPHATVFHRREFLETTAEYAGATLHPLVGYKGQEPVGQFPVFEVSHGFVTMAFSPLPNMGLSQLGPVLGDVEGLKHRTAEKRIRRFLEESLEWIDEEMNPSYVHVRTHRHHDDPRPFEWNEFAVTPRHTYVVDLAPAPDELLMQFSGDARRNVRTADEERYEISEGGVDAIDRIVDHLDRRHAEQGLDFPVDSEFVRELYHRLPDGSVRAYVCTVDGEYAGGMITLEDDDTVYRWQGGARPAGAVDVPVNDLLDWHVMTDGIERGREKYDLVGANTPQLCEYKSKFGPSLRSYQSAERGTRTMRFVSGLYQRFR